MAPNQSALESTDSSAFNEGSNFENRPLEIDLVSFEVHGGVFKKLGIYRDQS